MIGRVLHNPLKALQIIKNANSKMKMLHVASKFIKNKNDLLHIYETFIRSRLEFSCTVWHSSFNKNNEHDIEGIQKSALKLIFKEKYIDYKNALKIANIESLHERREMLCLRFAKKCLKMENFKKLFPVRNNYHKMDKRKVEKFHVKYADQL